MRGEGTEGRDGKKEGKKKKGQSLSSRCKKKNSHRQSSNIYALREWEERWSAKLRPEPDEHEKTPGKCVDRKSLTQTGRRARKT